jgi:iron-sulfur cluster assembly protein
MSELSCQQEIGAEVKQEIIHLKENYNWKIVDYLTVTEDGLREIRRLLKLESQANGLRISLRRKGCTGMSYEIGYAHKNNITKYDDLLKFDEINFFVDPKISLFIIGTVMDFKKDKVSAGFIFENPNEGGRCGCGSSFYVK